MKREAVEAAVAAFFDARLSNEADALLGRFAEGAKVRVAGATGASGIAGQTSTDAELRATVAALLCDWRWMSVEVRSLLIDGNAAAVRYTLQTTHLPTQVVSESESMDQFFFDETGRITEMIEFVDTAKVAQLERLGA